MKVISALAILIGCISVCLARNIKVHSSTCGTRVRKSRHPHQSRVIAGKDADLWPWQVQLQVYSNYYKSYEFQCGGSLINDQWVVTAAHCVFMAVEPQHVRVILGDYDRQKSEGTEQMFNVVDVRWPKDFLTTKGAPDLNETYVFGNYLLTKNLSADVALLKLDRKVTFNDYVRPICLPPANSRIPDGKKCFVTGWGNTKHWYATDKSHPAVVLQQAILPTVNHKECDKKNSHVFTVEEKAMLCAGDGGKTNKSSCYGDSGGPFNCEEGGVFVLRGIVSWVGDRSCKTGSYNVLARTSSYVDWINKEISSPPPTVPKCKDNHWYCKHWNSKKLCHHFYYKKALEQFCPITCQKQGCPASNASL